MDLLLSYGGSKIFALTTNYFHLTFQAASIVPSFTKDESVEVGKINYGFPKMVENGEAEIETSEAEPETGCSVQAGTEPRSSGKAESESSEETIISKLDDFTPDGSEYKPSEGDSSSDVRLSKHHLPIY